MRDLVLKSLINKLARGYWPTAAFPIIPLKDNFKLLGALNKITRWYPSIRDK